MTRKIMLFSTLLGIVFTLSFTPAAAQELLDTSTMTIAEIVAYVSTADAPELTRLANAIEAADPSVAAALSDPDGTWTLFVPTDAAFAALEQFLGETAFAELLADPGKLSDILMFHLLPQVVTSADMYAGLDGLDALAWAQNTGFHAAAQTLNGQYLDIRRDGAENLTVNGTALVAMDLPAANGVLHVIETVLLPEERTIADILASAASQNTPEFTMLIAALGAAEPSVLDSLSDPEGAFTLFAPTDAAFTAGLESLGMAADELFANPDLLTAILTYHIVPGIVGSTQLTDAAAGLLNDDPPPWLASGGSDSGGYLNTLNGLPLRFTLAMEYGIFIDGASMIVNDFDAGNGIIHAIDTLNLPPMD